MLKSYAQSLLIHSFLQIRKICLEFFDITLNSCLNLISVIETQLTNVQYTCCNRVLHDKICSFNVSCPLDIVATILVN